MADRGDQWNQARRRRAHHDFFVERPQIFERAAAARDDQKIGPRHRTALRQRIEPGDGGGDLGRRAVALHLHRPDQHVARKTVGEPMQNVANDGAARRGDDADHRGQIRQELLARLVEQSLGGQPPLALFQQRHERAKAGRLERFDDDLILRAAGIGGQPPGDHDFEAGLELELDARGGAAPDHAGRCRRARP